MPAYLQLQIIKQAFPNTTVLKKSWNSFEIFIKLQPTPLSDTYKLKIIYRKNLYTEIYVIDKILKLAPNRKKLPHVYDSDKQKLCLYSPSKREWKPNMRIVNTIIPWASEWLYYYELWLPEGQWYGGGHDEYPNEKLDKVLRDE
ncbi:hypothetical protein [Winogradskyella bathintestinalis]|uniref:Type II CBASS E2 protein domain-containing protein n=1 Tax=Winogradskyella bathintestinalis TaxID=3035208 RepID=A0ABT7ZWW3_9FLAO|nr:hypothetical protein [Winogradskyella bathintestinalis]MDN3493505.1 hypothetical protein [Winogradskyella bathintestinalis]